MKITSEFEKAYKSLNPSQKKAVDTIEGPVLTLAGPGTGKTQVLTLRIAEILRRTQMNAYNILCLTFTESAALEMKERLVKIIGPSGYDATITTFHGFANSVIQEFPFKFGPVLNQKNFHFNNLDQLGDFERYQIIHDILIKNKWEYLSSFRQPLYFLSQISKTIQNAKREYVSPQSLKEQAQAAISQVEAENKKSDQTLLNKLNRTLELAKLYEIYQQELISQNKYDYEDMINWVVNCFKEDPELGLIYQERYQYILVDEYQDTNNSQLELLSEITKHFGPNANIFVVGDPNQSIYRFQGASTININQFKNKFSSHQQIALNFNYRSGQEILDSAYEVIQNNPDAKEFNLPTLKSKTDFSSKLTINSYLQKDQETSEVALQVKELLDKNVPGDQIAILLRTNRQIIDFAKALDERQIPYQTEVQENVLSNIFIYRLITFLRFIANPLNKDAFKQICFMFRNHLGLEDALSLSRKKLSEIKDDTSLTPNQKRFTEIINDLAIKAGYKPVAEIIQLTIQELGMIDEIDKRPDDLLILNALKGLLDDAKKAHRQLLPQWLERLDLLTDFKMDLTSESILYGESQAPIVTTIHKAKGREYEYVFMPEMQENLWTKKRSEYFHIPEFLNEKTNFEEDIVSEARRLFYVGLTRAKKEFIASVAKLNEDQEILPNRFLKELPEKLINFHDISESPEETKTRSKITLTPLPDSLFDKKDQSFIKEVIKNSALSPTGFGTFRKCPKDFFIKNILRIPSIKSPTLSYGTAIHEALEQFFREYKLTGSLPSKTLLITFFNTSLNNEILDHIEHEKQQLKGEELLSTYFDKFKTTFQAPVALEYSFAHRARLGDIPITGKIDKIEVIPGSQGKVRVIDYKTGTAKSRNELLGKTKKKDTNYLDQLKFYNILAQNDRRFKVNNWEIGESQLLFMDDKYKFKAESFIFSKDELKQFEQEIIQTWKKIEQLDFPHHDGNQYDCDYCHIITL